MMKTTILLAMVLSPIVNECSQGCLKCNINTQECDFCDLQKGYKLSGGKCEEMKMENCAFFNFEGECLKCEEGYFVDSYTGRCVKLPRSGSISNCKIYSADNVCKMCNDNFYLNTKNSCMELSTPISNCWIYRSPTMCQQCDLGYVISMDYTTCSKVQSISNCSTYSPLKCLKCNDGYKSNQNNYLYDLFNLQYKTNAMYLQNTLMTLDEGQDLVFGQCQKLDVPNCLIYSSFNECSTCVDNYYVENGKCISYPFERIIDCEVYKSVNECIKCKQGMFLQSSTSCVNVQKIEECSLYDASASVTKCLECNKTHYLSEDNVCSKRTDSSNIDGCLTLSLTQEICEQCIDGRTTSNDKSKCFPVIENCSQYEDLTPQSKSLTCKVCQNTYFYDQEQQLCVQGTIDKCLIYQQNQDICIECENRHYLSGGTCKTHADLVFCDIYSKGTKNSCNTCLGISMLFNRLNTCSAVVPIDNCNIYHNTTVCKTCNDGYELVNNTCQVIPGGEFCLQKQYNKCIKCLPTYILHEGTCYQQVNHLMKNCNKDNLNGLIDFSEFKCDQCKENTIPINYKNSFLCYEKNYLQQVKNMTIDDDCLAYKKVDGADQCWKCKGDKLLQNGQCVDQCNNATQMVQTIQQFDNSGDGNFDSFYIDQNNICGDKIDGCKVAAPDLEQDLVDIQYSCIECEDNHLNVVALDDKRVLIREKTEQEQSVLQSPLSYSPSITCKNTSNVHLLGLQSSAIPYCNLYYEVLGFGTGCLKCDFGYHGEVVDVIYKCKVYSSLTTCSQCMDNYYPKTQQRCEKVNPINNCEEYENNTNTGNCKKCIKMFYLSATNVCTSITKVSNCNEYNTNADTCKTCMSGYVLIGNVCHEEKFQCQTYKTNGDCELCNDGYYQRESRCYAGKVTNCLKYDPTLDIVNICIECQNQYFLKDNQCIQQTISATGFATCDIYQQEQGYCKQCLDNSLLFLRKNKCKAVVPVTDCATYKTLQSCSVCSDGKFPVNYGQRCIDIPASKNCLKWGPLSDNTTHDEDKCIQCKPGYLLINNMCRQYFQAIEEHCDAVVDDVEDGLRSSVQCKYCKSGYEPASIANHGLCLEDELYQNFQTVSKIDNCELYKGNNGSITCQRCKSGYYTYIDTVGTLLGTKCVTVQQCIAEDTGLNHTPVSQYIDDFTSNGDTMGISYGPACVKDLDNTGTIRNTNKCIASPAIASSLDGNATPRTAYVCIECLSDLAPAINLDNKLLTFPQTMESPLSHTMSLSCIDLSAQNVYGDTNSKNEVLNCSHYQEFNSGDPDAGYGCVACDYGYNGVVMPQGADPNDEFYGFIQSCSQQISNCDNTVSKVPQMRTSYTQFLDANYTLNFDLSVLFNGCPVCTTGYVSTVFVAGSTAVYLGSPGGGDLLSLGSYEETTPGLAVAATTGVNQDCVSSTAGAVGSINLHPQMVANCQKQIVYLNNLAAADTKVVPATGGDLAVVCVECEPKYQATRITDHFELVTTCTLINDCDASTWANNCSECKTGHAYKYDLTNSNNEIRYDECVSTTITNCYAVTTTGVCQVCEKGYTLADNKCNKISPPKCSSTGYNSLATVSQKLIGFLLSELKSPAGCEQCESGFSPLFTPTTVLQAEGFPAVDNVCVHNTDPAVLDTNVTDLILNCNNSFAYYLLSTNNPLDIHCRSCNTGYVITLDGQCIDYNLNKHCEIATSSTTNFCHKCKTVDDTPLPAGPQPTSYVSVGGVCTDESTMEQNCDLFADASFKTGAICTKCKDTFYLITEIVNNKIQTKCQSYDEPNLPIKNCAQFNSDNIERLYCEECKSNFALLILEGDELDGNSGYNRTCINITNYQQQNCKQLDVDAQANGQLICDQCKDNFFIEDLVDEYNVCVPYTLNTNCKETDIDKTLEKTYQGVLFTNNYFPRDSTLKCKICDDGFYLKQDTNSCETRSNNDATYNNKCMEFEVFEDKCKTCIENYFLSPNKLECIASPFFSQSNGSILQCINMNDCKAHKRYQGLNQTIESLLSCHDCVGNDKIPFIAVSGGASYTKINNLNQYSLSVLNNTDNYNMYYGGKSVFCEEPIATKFNIDNSKFNFPANCGVGVVNVDSQLDASDSDKTVADRTKLGVFCTACKPGFKPTYALDSTNNLISNVVVQCVAIANCEQSQAFNSCSKCVKDYAFKYDNGEVQYDECVLVNNNPDCFSYNTTDTKCIHCCKGTYLNKDGYCERIDPARCEHGMFQFRQIYDKKNLNTGLFLNQEGTGCNKCVDGFVSMYQEDNYFSCTESLYHASNLVQSTTNYIHNCKVYSINNDQIQCSICKDNYIPIESTGTCTSITQLSNCQLAKSESLCMKCSDGFVLVNNACESPSINKCEIYLYKEDANQQICDECEEGYYLDANTCKPGEVQNCLRFETISVCNECNPGFHLVYRNDGVSYCYPIDDRLNCKKFDFNSFQTNRLECTECKSNLFVIDTDQDNFHRTHCLKFFETPNCVKYDIRQAVGDSSFRCLQCTNNFYLNNYECQVRNVQLSKCKEYDLNNDQCSECEEGYYVSDNGQECLLYPTGVPNCRQYLDNTTCTGCQQDYYLSNNSCIKIEDTEKVDSCRYYVAPSMCDICVDNYMNMDGQCREIKAQNCSAFESITACADCPQGSGFVDENGIRSCVTQTVDNCTDFNPNPPYLCQQCNDLYFPVEGVCQAVTVPIVNCLQYDSAETCIRCDQYSVLSIDKKKCMKNQIVNKRIDLNCMQTNEQEEWTCNSCQSGYFFEEGDCKKCEGNQTNCQYCDPINNDLCLLCESGYYMDGQGKCVEFVKKVVEVDDNDPFKDQTDSDEVSNGDDEDDKEKHVMNLTVFVLYYIINYLF